jgi:hypothetical protein
MAVGNMGGVITQLEGYLASEFAPATYNRNQGSGLIVDMVRQIASRADLSYTALKVTPPVLFDGTNDVTVVAAPAALIGIVAATNASAAEDEAVIVYEATVTEGTTRYVAMLNVDAGGTTATGTMYYTIFPQPIPVLKLIWSVVDNGSDTDIEGSTLGDANGTKVMIIYAT